VAKICTSEHSDQFKLSKNTIYTYTQKCTLTLTSPYVTYVSHDFHPELQLAKTTPIHQQSCHTSEYAWTRHAVVQYTHGYDKMVSYVNGMTDVSN